MSGCLAPTFFIIKAETGPFLFVGSMVKRRAAPQKSTVRVFAEPLGKIMVRPRFFSDLLLADPSHMYAVIW